ncbi:MAG: MBL fold metallo-hydrolase [Candidatus Heimdallarchaeota archaeon]|nr:MBL fold metallo-hydrolase [Candidatus Heimdallarchaeota archaeon]
MKSSENPNPTLTILNVGHGNAAVLHDSEGIIIFDTGPRAHVLRYLNHMKAFKVNALLLSHADSDHIGGANSLLLSEEISINAVFLNPDSTKKTEAFKQLRYALLEAEKRKSTKIDSNLTTSTSLPKSEVKIEILYPHVIAALVGVGGKDISGNPFNSNSLSAAIRVSYGSEASVLLGGDIEFSCLNEWKNRSIEPISKVLVFPHHGGLPSGCTDEDACIFAFQITKVVNPEFIVFSIHRNKFNLPRDGVLKAIISYSERIFFACTQLPDRFYEEVEKNSVWKKHVNPNGGIKEGSIRIDLAKDGVDLDFIDYDL